MSYGCQALAKAIITQCLMDLSSKSEKKELVTIRREWLHWLFTNGEEKIDFIQICSMADEEPENIRRRARKVMEEGYTWRKPPCTHPNYRRYKTKKGDL